MCSKVVIHNTIPGFHTLMALITFESASDKGNTYPQFRCSHGFVLGSTALVGVGIDVDGIVCVCEWFVRHGRLVLRMC